MATEAGRDPAFAASPSSPATRSRPDGLQSGVGAYAALISQLREPAYWTAEYGPDDKRLDIAPRHASDALEICVTALQRIWGVVAACEGPSYDLILSYADNALRGFPQDGVWLSGEHAIEAHRAGTAK